MFLKSGWHLEVCFYITMICTDQGTWIWKHYTRPGDVPTWAENSCYIGGWAGGGTAPLAPWSPASCPAHGGAGLVSDYHQCRRAATMESLWLSLFSSASGGRGSGAC